MIRRTAWHVGRLVWAAAPFHLAGFVALSLSGAVVPVAVAWLTKLTLDRLVVPSPLGVVAGLAAGLAAAGVAGSLGPQAGRYLRAELDRRVRLRAKDELFSAVDRFTGLSRLEDPAFLDRLRMAQESASAPAQLVDSATGLAQSAVTLVGFVGALAVISPAYNLVVLASAVPALLLELRLARQRAVMAWRLSPVERREMFYGELLTRQEAAKEIRLFGLGPFLRGRMLAELRVSNAARRSMDRRELLVQGALLLVSAVIAGAGLVWVIASAAGGALSVGDVSMFVAAVAGVRGAADGLVQGASAASQQVQLFCHYLAVVEAGPDLPEPSSPRPVGPLGGCVEFRDVWFRYGEEHPWVLRGLNLTIPYGAAVAVVGRNGSGKSTLVKLLCRFYDPARGAILWDGVDLREMSVTELRARVGAVFQDFVSYDFTAADNIAVGDLTAVGDHARISAAAVQAGVHSVVTALPHGYETPLTRMFVGEGDSQGVVLSGGQWQRLALARAFLRMGCDLMILDEPSAGLDPESEHGIHTGLRRLRGGRTSVLVSHRLGAIRDADVIAVLEEGVVVELGAHDELIALDGVYARMFHLQAEGYASR
ncbi:ABC transporter ATP-binding protein [Nonomuraea sp. NPDC050556]|uniref:ABC transporter ATP-binding protein n=1 Tax=Nonomuraea sp. NPDC050556 TaxID=3364369 RepID=UPI003796FCB8